MLVDEAFETDWKLDITATNHVLNFKLREFCLKKKNRGKRAIKSRTTVMGGEGVMAYSKS